jgi:uncharacterized protein (TIGR00730 family)
MKVCIYCASSPNIDTSYFEACKVLARLLVKEDISVVYGGGASGLMGCLADTVIAEGGRIKGIMPQFMNEVEWAHKKVEDFEFTDTMHERKAKFLEGIDGIIALPGGTGTLEELLEAVTLKRLGIIDLPILILNTNRFYTSLQDLMTKMVEEKFMQEKHHQMWHFSENPDELIQELKKQESWRGGSINFQA